VPAAPPFHPIEGPLRVAVRRTLEPVEPIPQPGQPCPGFVAKSGQGWRMLYSGQLQATHCHQRPAWTGRWFSPRGDRWFRVRACPDHLNGLTGLRQFGSRREP